MRIQSIHIRQFKRFSDLSIINIPETARLVVLTGPNGSGKSSLFDAFNYWHRSNFGGASFDVDYHLRSGDRQMHQQAVIQNLQLQLHDVENGQGLPADLNKLFYIRTAYRHTPDFTANGLQQIQDAISSNALGLMIHSESRIPENYNRIVGRAILELFATSRNATTALEIRDRVIGEVRSSMLRVFGDLILTGAGDPTNKGTFRFTKGTETDFHYKNLSGGEKAAFDLLLDFIIKKQAFDDTIFCIDEPELHMHTKLQGKLLEELFALLPERCQLWISTHSIGMARKANELNRQFPRQVAFVDFHDQNFDQPVMLTPAISNRTFWKRLFDTALDDLSQLVVPANVVFCEGRRLGQTGREPSFDVSIYTKLFENTHPDTEFIPLGGTNQVATDSRLSEVLLRRLAPGIVIWSIFDRDDRTTQEIADCARNRIKVLARRDLESYLWDDEILTKLAVVNNRPADASMLINEKTQLLANLPAAVPRDDVKAITGQLFNFCRRTLQLVQCGNTTEAFTIHTLAPLITPETQIYRELEMIIFDPF